MTRYEHTQIGHIIVWSLLAIILIATGGLIGHRAQPVIMSIILLVCLVLFYRLEITIKDETLCASFGLGITRFDCPCVTLQETVLAYRGRSSATPSECSEMMQEFPGSPLHVVSLRPLFRQFAEPVQSDRGLSVIYFVSAMESPDSHSIEPGSLD